MGFEINDVVAKLGITTAQAEALDAIDGKDGKISESVFNMAQALNGKDNQSDTYLELQKQDAVLANQVDRALNPLPKTMSKESERALVFAGIDKDMADWINIKEAAIENLAGKKYLVLKSSDNFELRIDLSDEKYDPSKIRFYRMESDCNIGIEGVPSGTLTINGADYDHGAEHDSVGFTLINSYMLVKGADGIADRVALDKGSSAIYETGDFADTAVYTENGEEIRLKPDKHHL